MRNIAIHFILFLLLLLDTGYSFLQHYHVALDGDLAAVVMPSEGYRQVLEDPFGLTVLMKDTIYAAPNRFFAHWFMSAYFKNAPLILQKFVNPVTSVYAASAIAKTTIQILIIFILAAYISGRRNIFGKDFLLAAVLVTPLFQAFGYNGLMGIIDKSITYTFFYALPLALLLLFFLPFFKALYKEEKLALNPIQKIVLLIIAVVVSFSGAIIPGVVLISCPLIVVNIWWNYSRNSSAGSLFSRGIISFHKIPQSVLFYFILISLLSLYSLYLGMYNLENFSKTLPIAERYMRLPNGLYLLFTQKLGFPLLVLMILVNALLIRKMGKDQEGKKILSILKWIGIMAAIYIVLLPFGGYREYRPNILRRDTLMPIILCLIFFYGISSFYLINHIGPQTKKIYIGVILVFSLIYTIADESKFSHNACEKQALETIARSTEKIVLINSDCAVLSWSKIKNPNESELNGQLMEHWGIIREKKLYYQK